MHVAEVGAEGVVFTVEAKGERASVQLKMLGRHNVLNALAAVAVGLRSGMGLEECAAAVGQMRAGDKRGEALEWRGAMLINDCYNSNPAALNAMVDALMAIPAERHIVVAGEMLELGPEGITLHAACGRPDVPVVRPSRGSPPPARRFPGRARDHGLSMTRRWHGRHSCAD